MSRPDRLPSGRQGDVDALGDQHRRVAFGAQLRQPVVEGLLRLCPGDVDPLTSVGTFSLRQGTQGLPCQCDRRAVAEVFGLGSGECVQVDGSVERRTGRIDSVGQSFFREVTGLALPVSLDSHPAIIATDPRCPAASAAPPAAMMLATTAVPAGAEAATTR